MLEPIFETICQQFFNFSPSNFQFIEGVTPFSTVQAVVLSLVLYIGLIFLIRGYIKNQNKTATEKKPTLRTIFISHNILLTVLSFILLILLLDNILPKLYHHGLFWCVCDEKMFDGQLEFFYFLNYLLKFYEQVDTILLTLLGKPLEFLHVYHHSLTLVLCYTQLVGRTSVQWVPITLNLFVHVIMYYYYARAASGHQVWWKKYLTTLQIVQFIIDLFFVYFCTYTHFAHQYFEGLPHVGDCFGGEFAAIFGCLLLSSYLLLFIDFFLKTYHKPKTVTDKPKTT